MSSQEYRYSAEYKESTGDIVYRPIIGVTLCYKNIEAETIAMIDSGSDVTVISADLALILGVDRIKCRTCKVGGVTGQAAGFIAKITVAVELFENKAFETDAVFMDNMQSSMLLGQKDLFERFIVTFQKSRKKFYLEKE